MSHMRLSYVCMFGDRSVLNKIETEYVSEQSYRYFKPRSKSHLDTGPRVLWNTNEMCGCVCMVAYKLACVRDFVRACMRVSLRASVCACVLVS